VKGGVVPPGSCDQGSSPGLPGKIKIRSEDYKVDRPRCLYFLTDSAFFF